MKFNQIWCGNLVYSGIAITIILIFDKFIFGELFNVRFFLEVLDALIIWLILFVSLNQFELLEKKENE